MLHVFHGNVLIKKMRDRTLDKIPKLERFLDVA